MKYLATISVAIAATVLAGCAGLTAGQTEPHGILVVQHAPGADATYPVAIVEINGTNLPGSRTFFPLAPGEHTVVVTALGIDEPTLLPSTRDMERAIGVPTRRGLVIEVKAGMRYTVAAHVSGPTTADWEPVLTKIEAIEPLPSMDVD